MDPVTAVGLASNVMQLIDFTVGVISEASKLSKTGVLDNHVVLRDVTRDLQELNEKVLQSLEEEQPRDQIGGSESDGNLRDLCFKSSSAASELLQLLQKYEPMSGPRYQALGQVIRLKWKKKDLDALSIKVERYRTAMSTHILVDLRSRLTHETRDQSQTTTQLSSLIDTFNKTFQEHLDSLARSSSEIASKVSDIHQAAGRGDLATLRRLLPRNAPSELVNGADEFQRTAAHIAVETGHLNVISFLHDRDADVNVQDEAGRTPLHLAIIERHTEIARYLLHVCKASIDYTDDESNTALDYAKHRSMTEWDLRQDVNPTGRHIETGDTALIYAVSRDDVQSALYMVGRLAKIDLNLKNRKGRSALMVACLRGNVETIDMLLQAGADPNASDHQNWTPVMHCFGGNQKHGGEALRRVLQDKSLELEKIPVNKDHTVLAEAVRLFQWDFAKILIQHGADVNTRDWEGYPILARAVQRGATPDIVELILHKNARTEETNKDGWSPLREALFHKRWRLLRLLIEHGAQVDVYDQHGFPLLCRLVIEDQYELIRLILDKRPDVVERKNKNNWTALREACVHGQEDIADLLLARNADINNVVVDDSVHPNRSGWTCLMQAAAAGRAGVVLTLIKHGAELERTDPRGHTALRIAIEYGMEGNACILLAKGASPYLEDCNGISPFQRAQTLGNCPDFWKFLIEGHARHLEHEVQ